MNIQKTKPAVAGTPRAPKQDRSRRMHARLLAAGRVCIERHGYELTGVGDIAREAGCSTGAFYHHFKGKEDFYQALVAKATEEAAVVVNEFFDAEAAAARPLPEMLLEAVWLQRLLIADNRELLVATLAKSLSQQDAWTPIRAVGVLFSERLLALLRPRVRHIDKADPERAVAIAVQIMQSTFLHMIVIGRGPLKLDADETVRELRDMMLGYLGLED